ncbi:MAG: type II secretion system protein [Planctomycetota bacterium]
MLIHSSKIVARATRRAGLTLIELVVVLTILVALGSLLVPVIGNALTRSHVATCASNIPETTKLLSLAALSGNYGDGWTTGVYEADDTAVNNSATSLGAGFGGAGGAGGLAPQPLTADDVAALQGIGMTNVFDHGVPTATGYDPTFETGLTTETIAIGTQVLTLDAAGAAAAYLPAAAAGQKYIWLGIDRTWSLLGTLTPEPPVHFGDTEGFLPQQVYSRFGAIFRLEGDSAQFMRVSYNLEGEADSWETADNHIGIHWNEVASEGF